ncbi:unnamed protein product [Laminaria digitata]
MEIVRQLKDAEQTQAFAAELGQRLAPLARQGPGVTIALLGGLGAGKTTFAQGLVAALPGGADLYVTSPTYALAQSYDTDPPVTHMDLYRLGSLDELEMIGYRDLYFDRGIAVVEWADRVPEALPAERIEVHLSASSESVRDLKLVVLGARLEPLLRNREP